MIEVNNLVRVYKVKHKRKKEIKQALKGVSFVVREGEIFGLLGPNGAGKTTAIKVLTTLLTPTSGDVKIMNRDVVTDGDFIRSQINFMFGGEKGVYGRLTAWEYLKYFACLYKVPQVEQNGRIEELLNLVELGDNKDHKIYTFSKGMIQRIHIARALINNPQILFLDEPTIGLDPIVAENIRKIIENLSKNNITVILTTHYMKEADDLCDRIGIINQGEIKAIGTPKEIKESYSFLHVFEATCKMDKENLLESHQYFKHIKVNHINDDLYFIRFEASNSLKYEDVRLELSKKVELISLEQKEITLEDAYINIVKVG
ncbi:ABC transporter ATP-binding protein [Robertmurraya sp. 2P01SA]